MTDNDKTGERLAALETHIPLIYKQMDTVVSQNGKIIDQNSEILSTLSIHSDQIKTNKEKTDKISNRAWGALVSGFLALCSFCGMLIKSFMAGGSNP